MTKEKSRFGIVKKMVLGITVVSTITYATSAAIIFTLQERLSPQMPGWLFILIILALGVFWTAFLAWIAAKWFVRPLLQLTNAANEASEGRLNVNLVPSGSDDELRTLGLSFAAMIRNMSEIISDISTNLSGTDTLADELTTAIGQAALHIEQITVTVGEIAQGAERQTFSSDTMLDSARRMNHFADSVYAQTSTAREMTERMASVIENSSRIIQSLVAGVKQLANTQRESLDVVGRLESHAREIGDISNMVGELSSQTHLLALNASIEAARAGEHGSGFAIVAVEVKKLAEQSAQAVSSINTLIEQIQTEVQNAVIIMTEQFELARRQSAQGESAAEALGSIISETDRVAQTVDLIASMVSEQAQQPQLTQRHALEVAEDAYRIREGAKGVLDSTQEQTAVMQEIAASSHWLRDQSARLKEQINFFKM